MKKSRVLLIAVLFLSTAIVLVNFSNQFSNKHRYGVKVQAELNKKVYQVQRLFGKLNDSNINTVEGLIQTANNYGIILLRYQSDTLIFWTSNSIPLQKQFTENQFIQRIVKINNSYYYVGQQKLDDIRNIALITLKYSYPHQNKFLRSGFHPDFNISKEARINFDESIGYPVYDMDQTYLFSVISGSGSDLSMPRIIIATLLFFLGLVLMAYYVLRVFQTTSNTQKRNKCIIVVIATLIVARIVQLLLAFQPGQFLLFDPFLYAESVLTPSLGDLLLNSMLVFFIAIVIFQFAKIGGGTIKWFDKNKTVLYIALTVLCSAFFIYAQYYSNSLVFNSSIALTPDNVKRLTIEGLICYLVIGINYAAFLLILIWSLNSLGSKFDIYKVLQTFTLGTVVLFLLVYLFWYHIDVGSIIFFYLFSILFSYLYLAHKHMVGYTIQVLIVLGFSCYLFVFLSTKENRKEQISRSSLALSLANEHDPVAEYLFEDLTQQIEKDNFIVNQFNELPIDVYALSDYIKTTYFTGFWNKYDLQITLCRAFDSVLIESPHNQWFHCYGFFDEIIDEIGFRLPDTRFYYLDNLIGRISYLGRFPYTFSRDSIEMTLFIELDGKLLEEFLGYPELLLDEKLHEERLVERYSYAKYYQNQLVQKHGVFSYSLKSDIFDSNESQNSLLVKDKYQHLLYRPDSESLIVISKPSSKFVDLLVGFSYIFLFNYLLFLLFLVINNAHTKEFRFLGNLRSRIQFSILAILLVSFVLIAGSTIWLSLRNYRSSQNNILEEKIQSVLIELSHKLSGEEDLRPDWRSDKYADLNQLLIKFSEVFYTDINMFSPKGELLATSRYEVFKLGLQGETMNPMAYYRLNTQQQARFIHREHIGALKYLSAYIPFYNINGETLAYLNLPYFSKQKEFQASISTLLLTIINIYVILMLIAIMLTILISDQITKPLEMLQMRFRDLKVGNKYEQIFYKRKDEIGNLVKEYNNMVLELERNINLLAKSERESAWREMAKQIAHEIKNPLTPMRLGVQQLKRFWNSDKENFEEHLDGLSVTLIEQIDNLSSIASEFSNFAKMPIANFEKVDLLGILKNVKRLFDGSQSFNLILNLPKKAMYINADKEQLSRVFINLVKNGAQSIPENRDGKVILTLEQKSQKAIISIRDNGKGIPEEIQPKLFTPNFTTKTSGMGLGLAIVKNIVDELNGDIYFDTQIEKGTCFTIELPLTKT